MTFKISYLSFIYQHISYMYVYMCSNLRDVRLSLCFRFQMMMCIHCPVNVIPCWMWNLLPQALAGHVNLAAGGQVKSSILFSQTASHLHIKIHIQNNVCRDDKAEKHSLSSCLPWYKIKKYKLWALIVVETLKTKGRRLDNPAVTGGTASCHNDNPRCHQRRQSCQIDDRLPPEKQLTGSRM